MCACIYSNKLLKSRSEPGYHNADTDFRIQTCRTDYIVEFKKDTIAQSTL